MSFILRTYLWASYLAREVGAEEIEQCSRASHPEEFEGKREKGIGFCHPPRRIQIKRTIPLKLTYKVNLAFKFYLIIIEVIIS